MDCVLLVSTLALDMHNVALQAKCDNFIIPVPINKTQNSTEL